MERLKKMEEKDYTTLARILFGLDTPTPVQQASEDEVKFFDETLNNSQRDAVKFALASREVALIHGPPGVCLYLPRSKMGELTCFRPARPTPS